MVVVVVVVVFRSVTDDSSPAPGRNSISTSSVLLTKSNIAFRCAGCSSEDMVVMREKAVCADHQKTRTKKETKSQITQIISGGSEPAFVPAIAGRTIGKSFALCPVAWHNI